MFMGALSVCICVHHAVQLQRVVSCHVGSGNQTQASGRADITLIADLALHPPDHILL